MYLTLISLTLRLHMHSLFSTVKTQTNEVKSSRIQYSLPKGSQLAIYAFPTYCFLLFYESFSTQREMTQNTNRRMIVTNKIV